MVLGNGYPNYLKIQQIEALTKGAWPCAPTLSKLPKDLTRKKKIQ
jgi:hypothetical protein